MGKSGDNRQGSFVLGKLSRGVCLRSFLPVQASPEAEAEAGHYSARRPQAQGRSGGQGVVVDGPPGTLPSSSAFSPAGHSACQKLLQIALTAHPGQDIAELWGP